MSRSRLFWAACAGMFVFGIVLALLGTLFGLPEMRARLDVNLAQQGDIFLALFFGIFLSTLLAGPVIDRIGNKAVLTVSALLVAVAMLAMAWADSYMTAAFAFVLGFGGGGLNTSTNALVSDLYEENRGTMLNLLGVFFGFGALFVPLAAAVITGIFSIPQLLMIAGGLAAALFVAYAALAFPVPHAGEGARLLDSLKVATFPGVMLFAILLFFESGNESSIGGWVSTYVGSLGFPARTATWILAGYWTALMLGRVFAARVLAKVDKASVVFASATGSAVGSAVLLASKSIAMLAFGAALIGFSFAAIYPTVLALAADRYQKMVGTVFGLLFAIALLGAMAFPWAIGQMSERWGVASGMALPLGGAIAIAVLAVVMKQKSQP